jgi:hypothetical protein
MNFSVGSSFVTTVEGAGMPQVANAKAPQTKATNKTPHNILSVVRIIQRLLFPKLL